VLPPDCKVESSDGVTTIVYAERLHRKHAVMSTIPEIEAFTASGADPTVGTVKV